MTPVAKPNFYRETTVVMMKISWYPNSSLRCNDGVVSAPRPGFIPALCTSVDREGDPGSFTLFGHSRNQRGLRRSFAQEQYSLRRGMGRVCMISGFGTTFPLHMANAH